MCDNDLLCYWRLKHGHHPRPLGYLWRREAPRSAVLRQDHGGLSPLHSACTLFVGPVVLTHVVLLALGKAEDGAAIVLTSGLSVVLGFVVLFLRMHHALP